MKKLEGKIAVITRATSGMALATAKKRSHDMRMMTMTMVTAIMLGGCASARATMFYEKPGVSEEQMRADEAACTRAALDTAGQRGAAFLSVDRDTVMDCMRARGYSVSART